VILAGASGDMNLEQLAACTSAALGCPAVLSTRVDVDGEIAFFVTPAGGA
jgi:hypothetical protein